KLARRATPASPSGSTSASNSTAGEFSSEPVAMHSMPSEVATGPRYGPITLVTAPSSASAACTAEIDAPATPGAARIATLRVRLLRRGLAVVEQAGLRVVVGELPGLATQLVRGHRLRERHEALRPGLERAAASERVRFVGNATAVQRLAMQPVALVVVHRGDR